MAVGVVAGGPQQSSVGSIPDAVTKCGQFVMLECRQLGLDVELCGKTDRAPKNRQEARRVAAGSFAEAKTQEAAGRISKLAGLKGDRGYLISAEYDAIVRHGVMAAVCHIPSSEPHNASMVREGYVFMPKPCTEGRKCRCASPSPVAGRAG